MESRIATRLAWILALAVTLGWGLADRARAQTEPTLDQSAAGMGKATYRSYCATCHGKKGKGDGPLAKHLRIPPTDVTTISQRNDGRFPFDETVKIIDGRKAVRAHGSPDMPVWGNAFQKSGSGGEQEAQAKISQLTHFVWSIQEEGSAPPVEPSEPPSAEPEPGEPPAAEPQPGEPPAPTPEPSEPPDAWEP